jgi:hypothetical protein
VVCVRVLACVYACMCCVCKRVGDVLCVVCYGTLHTVLCNEFKYVGIPITVRTITPSYLILLLFMHVVAPQILFFPWLIHGTFDFCLMVSTGAATKFSFIGFFVAFVVFLGKVITVYHVYLFCIVCSDTLSTD